MASILHHFWNLIFPRTCIVCSERVLVQGEENICTYCRARLPQTDHYLYPASNVLYQQLVVHLPLKYAFAYLIFTKSGRTQQLLHHLKYRNMPELGEELGRWYGAVLAEGAFQQHFDAVVPIPLHKDKLRKRGYNQSYHFALGLGVSLGLPVWAEVVVRKSASETQTRKSRLKRWQNVAEIFEVVEAEKVAGSRLLLVDDVITTGATVVSCAEALQAAGCSEISFAALATA
ncbi:amidophosphoribosyltransferase [Flammeovirgaceae bacterium 311]|nr:amidophosphoribosyltransferase [Flammeovirgaceae bacterium 311]